MATIEAVTERRPNAVQLTMQMTLDEADVNALLGRGDALVQVPTTIRGQALFLTLSRQSVVNPEPPGAPALPDRT